MARPRALASRELAYEDPDLEPVVRAAALVAVAAACVAVATLVQLLP